MTNWVGLPVIGRLWMRSGLRILTYHSFGAAEEFPYLNRMPIARFKRQIDHLERHYRIVSLEEALSRCKTDERLDDRRPMVAITVDDGYSDNYEVLYGLARDRNIPVTVFLATNYLDSGCLPWPTRVDALVRAAGISGLAALMQTLLDDTTDASKASIALKRKLSILSPDAREDTLVKIESALQPAIYKPIGPLSWQQVKEMRDVGVAFGSHTCLHSWLDKLGTAAVRTELSLSKSRIEAETGLPCSGLAYPNGNWNAQVAALARESGYRFALTQDRGINDLGEVVPYALRRIEIPFDEHIGSFACRVSNVAL
ncbi:MAG: polysaccharide deacetylase family protein [Verrucomicrobiales bacterium]|nr:polysaccharide deacetylase family protein [Verrucomicrobiales bacterium]